MSSLAARVGCTVKAKMTLLRLLTIPLFFPARPYFPGKGWVGEDARGARLFGGGGGEGRGKFKNCFPSFLLHTTLDIFWRVISRRRIRWRYIFFARLQYDCV